MPKEDNKVLIALKKAHTHLERVIRMVEGNEYCVDILQQNLAVIGLLKSANQKILEGHLNHCFMAAMRGTNETKKREMIDEIMMINRLSK